MICHFCKNRFQKNRELGLPEASSVIYEDDHIYVMPDISPLAVGHMLVVSKKHFQGYGGADVETIRSLEIFLEYYRRKIGGRTYTLFEHGATVPYHAGASIDHAHMHIVPFEIDMKATLEREFGEGIRCGLGELGRFGEKKKAYLFFKSGNEIKGRAYPVGEIESQYLRKVANQLVRRKSDFNWKRTYRDTEAFIGFHKTLAWWKSLSFPINYKWKKKLILEKYQLSKYEDLIEQTVRLRIEEEQLLEEMIEKELILNEEKYCRIVLVPMEHRYKLPNYIVGGKRELEQLHEFLEGKGNYCEMWYHTHQRQFRQPIYSGRISYTLTEIDILEIVELVSGDNPRKIESYCQGDINTFYLRISREEKSGGYRIDSAQERTGNGGMSPGECQKRLEHELNKYREKLLRFVNMVKRYQIYSCSIDFNLSDAGITFIDWDTSDDECILEYEKT